MANKIIDDFLNDDELSELKDCFYSSTFPLFFTPDVTSGKVRWYNNMLNFVRDPDKPLWDSYFSHVFYQTDDVKSNFYPLVYNIFIPKFKEIFPYKSLLRIKLNHYPHTETLREHSKHVDYSFSHHGAVFSLNTCDGFTRLDDGTKADSIENRIVFFDPSLKHNSSTTTNSPARWNINFNFL
tara:strand:+ start:294 stop:839 length:546 start_codon:yes stop_codon:yes gene_type:complete